MRCSQFAKAIGLMPDDGTWQAWHRKQVPDTLYLASAVEKQAGASTSNDPVERERIVNEDGRPGAGFHRISEIATT